MGNCPTPQAISALLGRHGFTRARVQIRNPQAGYRVREAFGVSRVEVMHYLGLAGAAPKRERDMLGRYAEAIREAGYRAEVDEIHGVRLLVGNREG